MSIISRIEVPFWMRISNNRILLTLLFPTSHLFWTVTFVESHVCVRYKQANLCLVSLITS